MTKAIFQRAILYARKHRANQDVHETLQRLTTFLKEQNITPFLDPETAAHFSLELPLLEPKDMDEKQDIIIVVGGDGSFLSAARMAVDFNIPVTGISRGTLGFLTDICPDNLETQLLPILAGKYTEENRHLLKTTIHDTDTVYFEGISLNDVVLNRGNGTRLIEFEVFINNQFVSSYRSDGLILATPTGSTAYSLSAGGPIMHPDLDAILMLPMFSHTLNARPLVFANDALIDIRISLNNEHNLRISCDGHASRYVKPGQQVSIKKYDTDVRLLHPVEYTYYDTLRLKLGWGFKPED